MIAVTMSKFIDTSKVRLPKTIGQTNYLKALRSDKCVTVVSGPAGTGKTLFACQEAILSFNEDKYERIIITRPTVGVDEDLGYLPGGIDEKMTPWMQPIYDILSNYYTAYEIERLKDRNEIEILPLAHMRGRTLENAVVIADEVQNATVNQTKTLLTRIGNDTKMVLMGDIDQVDIEMQNSGLVDLVERISEDLEYIEYVSMDADDVQRHPAIKEILSLYKN